MNRFLFVYWIILCATSCSDEERAVKPVPEITVIDNIDQLSLTGSLSVKSQSGISYKWTTTTAGITLINSDKATAWFSLPEGVDEKLADITLTVTTAKDSYSNSQTVIVPGLTPVREYGLGKELQAEKSNSVDYSWYWDQITSGTYSAVNCGPTVVTMAIKWADQSFTKAPADARMTYRPAGGWWFTNDIIKYLNDYEINNYTVALTNMDVVREELDNGNIAILCLDMYYVKASHVQKYHYNKFYATNAPDWGHFIIIKGYKEVDGTLYFEAYDPNSWGSKYADGELKGKDRYYTSADLNIATNVWWDYTVIVSKESSPGAKARTVDTNTIEHKSGR